MHPTREHSSSFSFGLVLTLLALAPLAPAQKAGKAYKNQSIGYSYKVPSTLTQVPINEGKALPCLKDKWSATKKPLYGKGGTYVWEMEVLSFGVGSMGGPTTLGGGGTKKKSDRTEDEERQAAMRRWGYVKDYATYLKKHKSVTGWILKGKKKKKRGKGLPYEIFQYSENSNGIEWVNIAARYKIGNKEIVLTVYYPKECARKVEKVILKCVGSLTPLAGKDTVVKSRRVSGGEYATTALRKRLLAKAVKSIQGRKEWDVFATKRYIVLYSFDDKSGKRAKALKFAKRLAGLMDEMNLQYQKYFPPHKGVKKWWSVLRICRSREEFNRYGDSGGGVIGWFSPLTKELVIFNASKEGTFSTDTVAFHEGWHQYADFWFPGAHLQRWFDEGHGDFFGSMKRLGKNRWIPQKSKMRKETIQGLVRKEMAVPLRDIITWHMSKFYGPRATDYYAQGWAMVDFFYRAKGKAYWRKEWSSILPTFIKVALKTKDTEKATKDAFKGVDFDALEKAFTKYVMHGL